MNEAGIITTDDEAPVTRRPDKAQPHPASPFGLPDALRLSGLRDYEEQLTTISSAQSGGRPA
jgi:hypothetical protein